MKKVIKVSLGKIAFTIEEDGYLVLKGYLEELNDHYRGKQNGNEIIEGIEERMAELFIEKAGAGSIVTINVINEVVRILGRPDAIDEESNEESYERSSASASRAEKRLYRDPDHKMIGGVCSGLAAYFNIEIAIVRVIFLVLLFISWAPHIFFPFTGIGGSFILLAYIVMWIAIPEARTVKQKFAMRGEKPDLSNIQRNVERGAARVGRDINRAGRRAAPAVNEVFRVISKIFAVFLVLFSLGGILLFSFLLLGVEIFHGFIPIDVLDYIKLGLTDTLWLKISSLAFFFLPLVGMLYGGIQILFEFRNPRFRPGLIIFILWVIAGFASVTLLVKSSQPYWEDAREVSEVPVISQSDTIFVKFASANTLPETNVIMEGDESEMVLFWMDDAAKDKKFISFPKVRIVRQSSDEPRKLRLRTQAFSATSGEAMIKAQKNLPAFELTDSLLTIQCDVYDKVNKWDGTNKVISIYVPDSVKVIVQEPVKFAFDANMRIHSGWDWCFDDFDNDRWERRWERKWNRRWNDRDEDWDLD